MLIDTLVVDSLYHRFVFLQNSIISFSYSQIHHY